MNYRIHYDNLINRARYRMLVGYGERHHVLPRCMGGLETPHNVVMLTAEEHFVAHQLLVKIYPLEKGLAFAVSFMAKKATGNKAYGWLRRRSADARRGTKHSDETRKKISAIRKGQKLGPQSAAHKANIVAAKLGKVFTVKDTSNYGKAWLGRKHSEETKRKLSLIPRKPRSEYLKAKFRGVPLSAETKAKMSASHQARHAKIRQ